MMNDDDDGVVATELEVGVILLLLLEVQVPYAIWKETL